MSEKINLCRHICVNKTLCPVVFETDDKVFATVSAGLMRIADFWWRDIRIMFPGLERQDVFLCGDLAGYVYNCFSEVSVGVLADLPVELRACLDSFNQALVDNEIDYKFINRPVHCRLYAEIPEALPAYSLLTGQWRNPPRKHALPLSGDALCQAFADYQKQIHDYVDALPKLENSSLSIKSCHELENFLKKLRQEGEQARQTAPEHEYSLKYLLWRTFNEIGGYKFFSGYLSDSYNYNINVLEQC